MAKGQMRSAKEKKKPKSTDKKHDVPKYMRSSDMSRRRSPARDNRGGSAPGAVRGSLRGAVSPGRPIGRHSLRLAEPRLARLVEDPSHCA